MKRFFRVRPTYGARLELLLLGVLIIFLSGNHASAQAQRAKTGQPMLADTLTWMDNTFNRGARGLVTQSSKNEHHYSLEETGEFTLKDCSMTLTKVYPGDTNADSGGRWKSYEERFELRDIDPATIRILPLSSVYMSNCTIPALSLDDCGSQARVLFTVRDEKALIHIDATTWEGFPSSSKAQHETWMSSSSWFPINDLAYAKRFAKAFRHAAELCGASPSSF